MTSEATINPIRIPSHKPSGVPSGLNATDVKIVIARLTTARISGARNSDAGVTSRASTGRSSTAPCQAEAFFFLTTLGGSRRGVLSDPSPTGFDGAADARLAELPA